MAKKIEGEKIKRALPFKLSDEEKARKGEAAARLNEKLAEAVDKKKTEVAKHTAGIKELQTKISNHLTAISAGVERREVTCIEHKNFEKNVVEFIYEGEVLETRPMTDADRQIQMNTKAAAKVKKAAATVKDIVNRNKRIRLPYKDDTLEEEPIAEVHRLETSRKTATTAVDPK